MTDQDRLQLVTARTVAALLAYLAERDISSVYRDLLEDMNQVLRPFQPSDAAPAVAAMAPVPAKP
jgi:hypothetical protein